MIRVGSAEWLYYNECDRRDAKIDKVIGEFKHYKNAGYNIDDPALQERVLKKYNLNNQLTDREKKRIASAVMQKKY